MDDFASERFWDRDANGGAGAEVVEPYREVIQFRLTESTQCIARGVFSTQSGEVYTWTVRRPGQGDATGDGPERCRLATRMPYGSFANVANGLLEMERPYIEPGLYDHYRTQVNAL